MGLAMDSCPSGRPRNRNESSLLQNEKTAIGLKVRHLTIKHDLGNGRCHETKTRVDLHAAATHQGDTNDWTLL